MASTRFIAAFVAAMLISGFASAQSSSPIRLGAVETSQQGGVVVVRVPSQGVAPHRMLLKDPDRIVLDFPGGEFVNGKQRIIVDQGNVLGIRTSQFQVNPPVARVVVDLYKPMRSRVETHGNDVLLYLEAGTAAPPAMVASVPSSAAPTQPQSKPSPARTEPSLAAAPKTSTPVVPASTTQHPVVEALSVKPSGPELAFIVKLSQPVTPKMWSEREPDRIVLDLPEALPGNTSRRVTVGDGPVQTVRLSLFQEDPPITRIVFDVAGGTKKPQLAANGNELTILFPSAGGTTNGQVSAIPTVPRVPAVTAPKRSSEPPTAAATAVVRESRPVVRATVSHAAAPKPAIKQTAQHEAVSDPAATRQPIVRFANGLLAIQADNSILTDILYEVGAKTGAEIQMPPWSESGREHVVVSLGPGNPRDVIAALLNGSSFNYVIVESPQGLQQLILTPKVNWPADQDQPPPPSSEEPQADAPQDPPPPEPPQAEPPQA